MAQPSKPAGPCCPHCGSGRIQRLRRRFVDRYIMGLLLVRPFYCLNCYRRFYSRAKSPPIPADELRAPASGPARPPQPPQQPKRETNATVLAVTVAAVTERRGFSRQPCEIAAVARWDTSPERDGEQISGMVTDISLTGCFLRSLELLPVGTELELFLETTEVAHSRSVVRRATPGKGMGLEFVFTSGLNFRRLQHMAPGSVRQNATP